MTRANEQRYDGAEKPETAWARRLRARYNDVAEEPLPDRLRDLLERLQDADSRRPRMKSRE